MLERGSPCPWCGKRGSLVTDKIGGQVICAACGLVVQDRTEEVAASAPWSKDSSHSVSITKPNMGLTTVIDPSDVDGSGKAIPGSVRPSLRRIRTWDRRSQAHSHADASMRRALGELAKLAEKVVVPEAVVERAAYVYRKSTSLISARGRSVNTLVAASLYAACRSTQTPRTLKDIGEAANLDRLDIARSYRLLLTEGDMSQPVADPARCLSRIAYGAHLSAKIERRGHEILKRAEREDALAGNAPMGLAAASLYIASVLEGERCSKTHLAMVSGLTVVTIRNRCKALVATLGLEPEKFDDSKARKKAVPSSH